jgi:hypothetical protein
MKLKRQLEDHYVRKHAINIWHGSRYPTFNSLIARVKCFEGADWPETNPTPSQWLKLDFSTTVS